MRYISELIDEKKAVEKREGSVVLPGRDRTRKENRVNLIALGDVGGTVLMGLRLLGGDVISSIGIYDLNENVVKRYEMEINQICFPDVRSLPEVTALEPGSESLYDCDMLVFCATKGVPPVTTAASATGPASCCRARRPTACGGSSSYARARAVSADPSAPTASTTRSSGGAPACARRWTRGLDATTPSST